MAKSSPSVSYDTVYNIFNIIEELRGSGATIEVDNVKIALEDDTIEMHVSIMCSDFKRRSNELLHEVSSNEPKRR